MKYSFFNEFVDIDSDNLYEIYINKDNPSAFAVGYIEIGNDTILIKSIGLNGEYDGYIATKIDKVFKINKNTIYLNKMETLIKKQTKTHETIYNLSDDKMLDLLNYSKSTNKVVSITLYDSNYDDVIGTVKNITEDHIIVDCIQYNSGDFDGESLIEFTAITKIVCDSESENNL